MSRTPLLLLCFQCLYVLISGEDDHERVRRDLGLLRMGKRPVSMLRMGRSLSLPPLVPPHYDFDEDELEERQVVANIPRMGKDLEYQLPAEYRYSRMPPVPRIGKLLDEYLNEYRRELGDDEIRQVYLKIPRVGRAKRSTDEVHEISERAAPLPRLGLFEKKDDDKRAAPLPRLGLYDRAAPLPRLGLRDEEEGYYDIDENDLYNTIADSDNYFKEEARAAPLPRLGLYEKRDDEKRGMSMLRMGKRPVSMLRMGRSEQDHKRAMGMLRMGKRAMGMLRMGRSEPQLEEEKRKMSMLRMGRSDNSDSEHAEEKRAMGMLRMGRGVSMLRMGRSLNPDEEKKAMGMLRMGKRPVSMLRMGKRPVSMLRMGKRDLDESETELKSEDKKAMGMLRMGRSVDENELSENTE